MKDIPRKRTSKARVAKSKPAPEESQLEEMQRLMGTVPKPQSAEPKRKRKAKPISVSDISEEQFNHRLKLLEGRAAKPVSDPSRNGSTKSAKKR
jgi:sRNA-binding protein